MKFHHNQKIIIKNGYYKTFKGFIINHKIDKENTVYLIQIMKKDVKIKEEWINENDLKVSWF